MRLVYLAILLVFICSCSNSQTSSTEEYPAEEGPGTEENMEAEYSTESEEGVEASSDSYEGEEVLFINGNDIWVRDVPTNGEVIMKLNQDDRCRFIEKGRFEVIRGVPHFWYQIEFDNKIGWVFGSQTSKQSNVDVVRGNDMFEIWENLVALKKDQCQNEESPDFDCYIEETELSPVGSGEPTGKDAIEMIQISYPVEDGHTQRISINPYSDENWFLFEMTEAFGGAMGIVTNDYFYVGLPSSSGFIMPNEPFEGRLAELHRLDDRYTLILSYQETRGIMYYFTSFYNVYMMDHANATIQVVNENIAMTEGGFSLDENEEGTIKVESSDVKFDKTGSTPRLLVSETMKKKQGDSFVVLDDPVKSTMAWDGKQRKFVIEN